jgi:integrase
VRHSTYICYETYIRGHIIPGIGTINLKALSSDIFQKFFNEKASRGRLDKQEGGLSAKTIRNIRNMLHLAIEQAIANDMLSKNVIHSVKLQRAKKKEVRVLPIAEQRAFEDACIISTELIPKGVTILLSTGMRIGELLALRWPDVDLDDGSIVIRNSLRRQNCVQDINRNDYIILSKKKENKTALMIGRVKTVNGSRTVYMTEQVIAAIKKIKSCQDDMKHMAGSQFNKMGFLFCTISGAAMDARYYQKVFYRFLKKAGVSQTNVHSLRHYVESQIMGSVV